ncbi:hypothetical protein [Pseudovibrio japonicus]|nr:hypothetical protein [Pseudovibrio japonicus]
MASTDTNFPRFVEKLASDPAKTPAMTVYMGYLGPSDKEGMVRIYGSPALSQFTEVAKNAILHSEPISGAQIDGLCAYWVSKSEVVSSGRTQSSKDFIAKQQAAFLEGDISSRFAPGAAAGLGGGQQAFLTSIPCTITLTIFLSCLPIDCLPTAH